MLGLAGVNVSDKFRVTDKHLHELRTSEFQERRRWSGWHRRGQQSLPVPGGPCNKTPLGGRIPMASNMSCVMGKTTFNEFLDGRTPTPISEYSSVGRSSTSMAGGTRCRILQVVFQMIGIFIGTDQIRRFEFIGLTRPGMGKKVCLSCGYCARPQRPGLAGGVHIRSVFFFFEIQREIIEGRMC
jgi:hypothetical protein